MELKNKVIVITGAAQGLGQAIAKALLDKGASLALLDVNDIDLKNFNFGADGNSEQIRCYRCNVADESAVTKVFGQVYTDFGQIDGLVNNAGILRDGYLIKAKEGKITERLSLEQWQTVIDVNMTGVFLCSREAASKMIEGGSKGVIINVSSLARSGNAGQTNYSAAKAGVEALTVTWGKELARYNIRTCGIAPGVIDTQMTQKIKPAAKEQLCAAIPSGRLGRAEEIAHSVIFLFENDYFQGRLLELDGGLRL